MTSARAMPFMALGLFGLYTLEFGVVGILPSIISHFHVTVSRAGQLTGFFALTIALAGPMLVPFSARQPTKRILLGSLTVFTGCSGLSATVDDFGWVLAFRIVAALFHPMFYAAALTTAISLFPPTQTGRAVSHAVVGTTFGLVVGVPMMSAVAAATNYRLALLSCAGVCAIAGLCLLVMLPGSPARKPPGFREQLTILRKPALWLNIAAVILIFTALFSVYSYAAEYMKRQIGLSDAHISVTLILFGAGGVLGNLLISRLLDTHLVKVVVLQPLALCITYLLLYGVARDWMPAIAPIALLWGCIHAGGLVASQMWLRSVSREAGDFATSLYLSAANLGVVAGSFAGGCAIGSFGMAGAIGTGISFAVAAMLAIAVKLVFYGAHASHAETAATHGLPAPIPNLNQQEQFR
ncbi:MFS transporter [Burkholderia cepacia]|uniref:MFS transporter n=1 Tax=Burkholderia cepacia TaxID=292 RepID=UPI00158D65E0|nr:MFS transporter [Burkholderia cepacia]